MDDDGEAPPPRPPPLQSSLFSLSRFLTFLTRLRSVCIASLAHGCEWPVRPLPPRTSMDAHGNEGHQCTQPLGKDPGTALLFCCSVFAGDFCLIWKGLRGLQSSLAFLLCSRRQCHLTHDFGSRLARYILPCDEGFSGPHLVIFAASLSDCRYLRKLSLADDSI